ncbi:TetR/AcrR family transcriptional regulator [Yinghuangia seranimata]|uniref:TetR/AcrR family transcriptional regulator n=1 Tax=Yinghuangia seranimata TaxID=408067 RepID=UPI00248D3017|nr:TetR family transcriptional regulator [Yinghuangia seranimata]MDI2126477.1 TetR family transcriptional regulator [Yinghuangia seranimata]
MSNTRAKLIQGALDTLRTYGISGTSARSIATTAGVNQALIFYHFGTLDQLLSEACRHGAEQHVAQYRARFTQVGSMRELLDLSRALHADEQADMAVLAHLLAGARTDPSLAPATAAGLGLWVEEIEGVLARVLADTPLAGVVDTGGLARAVAATFIGLELYGGVDGEGTARAFDALDQLGTLVALLEDLGPLTQRAVRSRLKKAGR